VSAPALPREIAAAGVGVGRLIRYDPRWPDGFNPTTGGFLRSVIGPLLALPFDLIVVSTMGAAGSSAPVSNRLMWVAVLSHLLNAVAYPALIAAFARPLKIGHGYAGFVIIVNWASLFVSILTAAASPLTLAGPTGAGLFTFVWLAMFGISLFVTWRAARETLSEDIPVALLMVVLSVGVGVVADQVSGFVLGVSPFG
jgi:hypothetical protein